MLKTVENATYLEIAKTKRFDSKYYFLGEVLNRTLSRFETKPLVSFTKFIKKGIFDLNSKFYRTEGIPFIRISNLKSFSIDEDGLVYIPLANHKKEIKTKLVPGDLALSKVGKYLGKIGAVPLRYPEVNISQNIIGVSFNCDDYLRKYIFLYLTTPLAINQILRVSKAHNQNKLTLPDIRDLIIPTIPEKKIRKYASVVEEIQHLENESFNTIEEAKNLLYKFLDIDFEKVKSPKTFSTKLSSIRKESFFTPEYSNPLYINTLKALEKFPLVQLSKILTIKKGTEVGSDNYSLYVNKLETDIPFIRTTDIVNHEIDNYPDFYISEDIYNEINQDIVTGDILFTNDGKIGQIALITENDKVIIQSHLRRMRLKSDIDEKYKHLTQEYIFLALSLKEIGSYQSNRFTVIQSTIPTISNHLGDFVIPILPKEKVLKLTEIVKTAFEKKNKRKKLLSDIKTKLEIEFEEI
ncbi:MAG: hypothetical protein M9911_15270 [Saprospiraceae bacterium]|nr:hypothetical protein [Saprospiraceae bacterium]